MTATGPDRIRSESGPRSGFRPDIQALRAIAIVAVVLNHFWPNRVSGGFVGVDVFFVISGYLITGHLLREIARTGTVRLREFYARRARRLLPAGLLVLAVTLVSVWLLMPEQRWETNGVQIAASVLYVENWVLAVQSVDYFAQDASPSAVQHYWSLSVEEQFYIVWPILLLVATVWVCNGRRPSVRARAVVALGCLGIVSLAASVLFTGVAPAGAYFATFTRAWEFAAGGLVALLLGGRSLGRVPAALLVLGGLVAIGWSTVAFQGGTGYPGVAALIPVLGTAAVILGGSGGIRVPVWGTIVDNRVVAWLGEISYSLYLWHWPALVITPFLIGSPLGTLHKAVLLAATLAVAWATRRFVEVPGMRARWVSASARRTMLSMALAMALIAAPAAAVAATGRALNAADSPSAALPVGACVGPDALARPDCGDVSKRVANPESTARDEYFFTPPECSVTDDLSWGDKKTTRVCRFSDEPPTKRVWLIGDSHAQQWQGALFDLARQNNWELTLSFYGGCPVADVAFTGFRAQWGEADWQRCRMWSRDAAARIERDAPDIVFTSMAARQQLVDAASPAAAQRQFAAGLRAYWQRWVAAGSSVVVIADTPYNGQVRSPDCLLLSADKPQECARPRAEALPADPILDAAADAIPGVTLLDFTDRFCDVSRCFAAVGGVAVYYDADHLSLEYVRLLLPEFASRLGPLVSPG